MRSRGTALCYGGSLAGVHKRSTMTACDSEKEARSLPELLESRRIAGRIPDSVLDVAVTEVVLNQSGVGAFGRPGRSRTHGAACEDERSRVEAAALYFSRSKLTVERCNGLRCSLTKKVFTMSGTLMRVRSFSQAAIALSSPPQGGCVVDNPPFNRATSSTRLSAST